MSGNMESLLMGGDSSSGESDDETNAGSTKPSPSPQAAAPAAAQAAPVPAPAATGGGGSSSSQDDMKARLKSLYSASKSSGGGGSTAPSARPVQPPPQQSQQQQQQHVQYQHPPQQQQQQQQQRPPYQQPPQQQQQQQRPMQHNYQQQQQQQQQQQPQHQAPRQSYSLPQQNRPSSQSMRPPPQRPPQQQQPPPQQHQHHMQRQHPQQQQPQQQQLPQQAQGHRSQQQQQHGQSSSTRVDPFAPTPLSQIQHRVQGRATHQQQPPPQQQQQPQPPQHQQQQQQQQRVMGSSSSRGSGSGSSSGREMSEQEKRELLHRRQKEKFLMFTRVLIKYLEGKDIVLHNKAKMVIKDCAERNKRGERGYESVTMAMQRRLKDLVGETYWKKAQDFLYYMHQKRKAQMQQGEGGNSGSSTQSPGNSVGGGGQSQQSSHQSQQLTNEQKRQMFIEEKRKQQAAAAAKAKGPTAIDKMRQEIHQKREQIANQTSPQPGRSTIKEQPGGSSKGSSAPSVGSPSTTTPLPTATKGKKATRRKSDGSSKAQSRKASASAKSTAPAAVAAAAAPAPPPPKIVVVVPKPIVVEPPREYEELMDLIDHAVDYDWPSIGQLLGDKKDIDLSEEERQLLYGEASPMPVSTAATTDPSEEAAAQPAEGEGADGQSPDTLGRSDWGSENVLSVRAAWAVLRLKEQKRRELEAASGSAPIVAGGLLTLPSDPNKTSGASPASSSESTSVAERPWVNEETAEKDAALALLSEGCQIYLKGVLEKGLQCARQRQNLDGIRLWHQQYAATNEEVSKPTENAEKGESSEGAEDKTEKDNTSKTKPPLLLRLGCDVSRQVAQAHGNAAMTVKRMEEALERQTGVPSAARELNQDTLSKATSMSDLAWRPLLKEGSKKADYEAKRSFEIYGGKESKDPPLGRVPKKAKLLVSDFIIGSELSGDGNHQRAYTASTFIRF